MANSISLSRCVSELRHCAVFPDSVFGDVLATITTTKGARALIDAVHAAGGHFGVVSGGFEEVVAPLAASLGIDFYAANRLEVEDGVLTGRVLGRIVTSQVKVECLREWASSLGCRWNARSRSGTEPTTSP